MILTFLLGVRSAFFTLASGIIFKYWRAVMAVSSFSWVIGEKSSSFLSVVVADTSFQHPWH
jgi:hypothetical protein